MHKPEIKIGLIGLGTVGRGVYKILRDNASNIERKVGVPIRIEKILVRDVEKNRDIDLPTGLLTADAGEILNNPDIDIVVELMGGTDVALSLVREALASGKGVVTANKDMIAAHGKELFALAEEHQADLLFEGSVGGGIPVIRPLKQCLAGNRIQEVIGIINGTTNYMLTRMSAEGLDFQDVLKQAQELGYAESDPAADIEGYDAARKLAILASIAFNTRITFDEVNVEGITRITADDIAYAKELNYTIKLLAIAKNTPEGIEVRVHPTLIPSTHPLAAVNDVFNAIFVRGDAVGDTMFYGRGAGEMPTASAVIADIMDAARDILRDVQGIIACTCYYDDLPVKDMGQTECKYYIRLAVTDRPGVLASIAYAFGDKEVSLASVIQKHTDGSNAEIVLVTHKVRERNLQEALGIIRHLSSVREVCNFIRVEDDI